MFPFFPEPWFYGTECVFYMFLFTVAPFSASICVPELGSAGIFIVGLFIGERERLSCSQGKSGD